MVPRGKALQLIAIYLYICELFESELQFVCERFPNNNKPEFSDQELITIYLFVMHAEQRTKIKQIHQFAKDYLRPWFHKLPSYVAFNTRLDRMSEALKYISSNPMAAQRPDGRDFGTNLLDLMPIITCCGKRRGKVAKEITDKTFCSTKGIWYHGVKLHVLGASRPVKLPFAESVVVTQAPENDLNVFKQNWAGLPDKTFMATKFTVTLGFLGDMSKEINSAMFTPVKWVKGQPDCLKFFDKAANDLFSKVVSSVRQPIEAFFNWKNEKTNIQRASYVRSTNGLLVRVFGKLAAAFIAFIF